MAMETQWVYGFYVLIGSVCMLYILAWRKKKMGFPLPPGPPGWPVVGNLFQLGQRPHEYLSTLSKQYGPLMTLRLGMRTTVVVSSAAMAKEILRTHDHVFAGRVVLQGLKMLSHHKSSISFGQNGPYWRKLRRISTTELMSRRKLEAFQHVRRDEVFEMIQSISQNKGKNLNIGHTVHYTAVNILGKMIFSTKLLDPNNPDSMEFLDSAKTWLNLVGTPNLVDYFPFLAFLDPQGLGDKITVCLERIHHFLDVLINNRLDSKSKENDAHKDMLDVLLESRDDDLTLRDIRAAIFELLTSGIDTTGSTLEWAMAEVIRNPEIMKRVQVELDEEVGQNRRVEESDIERLPYLQAVVKEVLRSHPAAPLMLPHRADSCCDVSGFRIPKHTQVMVNVWAIARDPAGWEDPCVFSPERFLGGEKSNVDFKGQDFDFTPFGAGRRICLGLPLADKLLHYILASILHSFDWALPDGMSREELDMADVFGVVLKKRSEMCAIPTPRLSNNLF